ncbi:hypothetical protein [Fischerella sp. JS2]|uniref:hypothetical protein n=1 Tax=Fischerella sp. JS2 TaxID=2597771 RepID=UPI0028EE94AA|nr:hypothetical protein [Fischerella sp. JS2]
MEKLRQKIWQKLRSIPKAEEALTRTKEGSKSDLDVIAAYLQLHKKVLELGRIFVSVG